MTLVKITTSHKMKFSIEDLFSKYDQIGRKPRIWPYLQMKILNRRVHFLCNIHFLTKNFAKLLCIHRSNRLRLSIIKDIIRNFSKFIREIPARESLFLKKLQIWGVRPPIWFKKRLWRRCFPVNFAKFLRIPFSQNTSGRLVLYTLH